MNHASHPLADDELIAFVRHYDRHGKRGALFFAAVEHQLGLLERMPQLGAYLTTRRRGKRKILIRRFPVRLIYSVEEDGSLYLWGYEWATRDPKKFRRRHVAPRVRH